MCSRDHITADDFILAQRSGRSESGKSKDDFALGTIEEMEKKMILKVIQECGGNLTKSSHRLGISRATLYRKMEKHGIQTSENE
jgi:transcriptional regulator of acetoin/glycerol metabolism